MRDLNNRKRFLDLLGLPENATDDEIKLKYRELAKKCHPDTRKEISDNNKEFFKLQDAYEHLMNDPVIKKEIKPRSHSYQRTRQSVFVDFFAEFPRISL